MSEASPRNSSFEAGLALQRQDEADPVRKSAMELSRRVLRAAYSDLEHPLLEEFEKMQHSFRDQFGNPDEAKRYRLYHYTIGSSPPEYADLFDAEGERSLENKLRELARKHHIDIGEV